MSYIVCAKVLTESTNRSAEHARSQLILKKQCDDLLNPATQMWKLVEWCERAFWVIGSGGQISPQKNIGLLLNTTVMQQDDNASSIHFPHLGSHNLEMFPDSEDLHSSQLKR